MVLARDLAEAAGSVAPTGYRRHRPETTLLHRLVAEHYPRFRDRRAAEGRPLSGYVEAEFESYLKCGLLEHGFLRVKCETCQAEKLVAFSCKGRGGGRRMAETAALLVDELLPRVPIGQWVLSLPFALRYLLATRPEEVTRVLGIVYRAISGHLVRKAGLTRATAATGAVTLIQRFGSAANLNVHLHLLVLDGVYGRNGNGSGEGRPRFVPVPGPTPAELEVLVQTIAERIGRELERAGLITRDIENCYLAFDPGEESPIKGADGAGAGAVDVETPYRDGATHIVFEPEDFIARLAALVPKRERIWSGITAFLHRRARFGHRWCRAGGVCGGRAVPNRSPRRRKRPESSGIGR